MALSKVTDANNVKVKSIISLDESVEEYDMKVDAAGMAHIINRLTDLYTNPIAATVREVISNAIDAMKKSTNKSKNAIKVTSPNHFNPYFIVEDFGVGMSKSTLLNNYSQYGGTTKLTDFEQIGAHGLGAKAPLSYCRELNVKSSKDGVKTEILLTRSASGNKIKVISEEATTDDNGTTVTIPVTTHDFDSFMYEINMYRNIEQDVAIEIDGELVTTNPKYKLYDNFVLDDDGDKTIGRVWINTNSDYFSSLLSSRNFAPSFDFVLSGWIYSGVSNVSGLESNLLIELKPAVLNFSSSRDEITKDDRYKKLAAKISDKYSVLEGANKDNFIKYYKSISKDERKQLFKVIRGALSKSLNNNSHEFMLLDETFTLDDFNVTDEGNYLNDYYGFGATNVYGALSMVNSVHYNVILPEANGKSFNHPLRHSWSMYRGNAPLVTAVNQEVSNLIANDCSYTLSKYMDILTFDHSVQSTTFNIAVITKADEDFIKVFTKARKLVSENIYTDHLVILADTVKGTDEEAFKKVLSGRVTFTTAAKVLKEIETVRATVKKARVVKSNVEEEKDFSKISTPITSTKNIPQKTTFVQKKLSEILNDEEAIFIAARSMGEVNRVIKGMINANVDVVDKTIYFDTYNSLNAKDFTKLIENNSNVYLSPNYSYSSKSFQEFRKIMANKMFSDKHLESELKDITAENFLNIYLNSGYYYFTTNFNSEFIERVAQKINDGNIKKNIELFNKVINTKYANDYADVSEEKVKENYSRKTVVDVLRMSHLLNSFSQYDYNIERSVYAKMLLPLNSRTMTNEELLDDVARHFAAVVEEEFPAIKVNDKDIPLW